MLVNLIQIKYSTFSYYYTGLGAGCSTKEATGSFFRRVLQRKSWKNKMGQLSALQGYVKSALRMKQWIASFVEQFK